MKTLIANWQIATIVFVFFILYTLNSLMLHWSYNTSAYDLGYYTQAVFQYSKNQIILSSYINQPVLGDHFEPILWVTSLMYFLWPKSEFLLLIQALLVSLSAIPLYIICLKITEQKKFALALILTYLCSIGITRAIIFDFHPATISVFPISILLYTIFYKNNKYIFVALLFAFLFKEDIPIITALIGVWLILQKRYSLGLTIIIISTIMLGFIFKVVFPAFAPVGNSYENLYKPNISTLFTQPDIKLTSLAQLVGNYALLPIFNLLSSIVVLPMMVLRFIIPYQNNWTNNFHHSAAIQPILLVASAYGLNKLKSLKYINFNANWLIPVLLTLSTINLLYLVIIPTIYNAKDILNQKYEYINNSLSTIPQFASVSAQSPIAPHISNRNKIVMFPDLSNVEYVILDSQINRHPLYDIDIYNQKINLLKTSQDWETFRTDKSLIIFKRITNNNP